MTPAELRAQCEQQIAFHAPHGTKPHLYLELAAPANPGARIRLLGNTGPSGELVVVKDEWCVALFDAWAVLRWLDKQEPSGADGAPERSTT